MQCRRAIPISIHQLECIVWRDLSKDDAASNNGISRAVATAIKATRDNGFGGNSAQEIFRFTQTGQAWIFQAEDLQSQIWRKVAAWRPNTIHMWLIPTFEMERKSELAWHLALFHSRIAIKCMYRMIWFVGGGAEETPAMARLHRISEEWEKRKNYQRLGQSRICHFFEWNASSESLLNGFYSFLFFHICDLSMLFSHVRRCYLFFLPSFLTVYRIVLRWWQAFDNYDKPQLTRMLSDALVISDALITRVLAEKCVQISCRTRHFECLCVGTGLTNRDAIAARRAIMRCASWCCLDGTSHDEINEMIIWWHYLYALQRALMQSW